jgi:thymidylate synthase (FAD)
MTVKLVSYSQPTDEFKDQGITDAQELIAFCARVSNPANQFNTETSDKLINYLISHAHWSPLEMVNVCLEVNTTRDIARQLLRHRSFSFQEFSQRYADPVKDLNFVVREARLQDPTNRQNSITLDLTIAENRELLKIWDEKQKDVIRLTRETYSWAIANNIAKEQARAVLPEGLMESKLYINGTLRSWIHYIQVRSHKSTQKEHRLIAFECAKAISKIFPMSEEFVAKPAKRPWFKKLKLFKK